MAKKIKQKQLGNDSAPVVEKSAAFWKKKNPVRGRRRQLTEMKSLVGQVEHDNWMSNIAQKSMERNPEQPFRGDAENSAVMERRIFLRWYSKNRDDFRTMTTPMLCLA